MTDGNRRFALVVGALAAAAGVAVATYVYYERAQRSGAPRLRPVTDVLSDCYTRLRDLREHLADLGPNLKVTREGA